MVARHGMSFSAGWQLMSQADDQLIRVDAEAEEEIAHAIAHYDNEREGASPTGTAACERIVPQLSRRGFGFRKRFDVSSP